MNQPATPPVVPDPTDNPRQQQQLSQPSLQPPQAPELPDAWWSALRLVTSRLIDDLQRSSANDATLRSALLTLLQPQSAAGQPPALAPPRPVVPQPIRGPVAARERLPLRIGDELREVPVVDTPTELRRVRQSVDTRDREDGAGRELRQRGFDADRATLPVALLAERCRLKARAARWQYERDGLERDELQKRDREVIEAAGRLPDCFLWMCKAEFCRTRARPEMDRLAECYEALAEAAELLARQTGQSEAIDPGVGVEADEQAVRLLAEAQSMLCVMLDRTRAGGGFDPDQRSGFIFAREQARRRGVFVDHLSYERPSSPESVADLRRRIAEVAETSARRQHDRQQTASLLNRITYHAQQLSRREAAPASFDDPDHAAYHDLHRIAEAVEKLEDHGIAATDRRVREALLPAAEKFPSDVPGPLRAALQAVDDYLDNLASEDEEEQPEAEEEPEQDDPTIAAARELVAGRNAVMIGGRPLEHRRRSIEEALGLASLNWVRVEHGQSFDNVAGMALNKQDVTLVLLLTRWRSHRDGPAARAICRQRGIPLVEIPAGYGVRQIAHRILEQAARRLATGDDAA